MALPIDYEAPRIWIDKNIVSDPSDVVTVSLEVPIIYVQIQAGYVGSIGYQVLLNGTIADESLVCFFDRMGKATINITGFKPGANSLVLKIGAVRTQANACGLTFTACGTQYVNSCRWIQTLFQKISCNIYNPIDPCRITVGSDIMSGVAWEGTIQYNIQVYNDQPALGPSPLIPLALASVGGYLLYKEIKKRQK